MVLAKYHNTITLLRFVSCDIITKQEVIDDEKYGYWVCLLYALKDIAKTSELIFLDSASRI